MTFADDAGEYSVFAKNQLGEVSASASLLEEGAIPTLTLDKWDEKNLSEKEKAASFDEIINKMCVLVTEEYKAYMKEKEVTMKQEVFAIEQEPRVADVPPVFITAKEPTSTTLISGQVVKGRINLLWPSLFIFYCLYHKLENEELL